MELNNTLSLYPPNGIGINTSATSSGIIEDKSSTTTVLLTTMATSVSEIIKSSFKSMPDLTLTMEDIKVVTTSESLLPILPFEKMNEPDAESVGFVLIPLFLIIAVAFLSGIGFFWMVRRRKFDRLRHRLIPTYTFSPGEDEEWGGLIDQESR